MNDINDVIISLGGIQQITAPCALNVTNAQLAEHLANNVISTSYTVVQVRAQQPIYAQQVADSNIENEKQANKTTASNLLFATDWTTIADVGNPQMANPYLANQSEFIDYRNSIRQYAVYPISGNINWAVLPMEVWKTV